MEEILESKTAIGILVNFNKIYTTDHLYVLQLIKNYKLYKLMCLPLLRDKSTLDTYDIVLTANFGLRLNLQ